MICTTCDGTGFIDLPSFVNTPDSDAWTTVRCPECQDEDEFDWRNEEKEE